MKIAGKAAVAALGIALLAGCNSPTSSVQDTTGLGRAATGSQTLYGYTTAGNVSSKTSTNYGQLSYNGTNTVENNDWGVPAGNGQGGSTSFLETIGGASAFGWAYNVTNGTNVTIYPEVGYGWSPNANASWGGNPTIAKLSDNRPITGTFAISSKHKSGNDTWDLAYDIWITSAQHPASVSGSYELMIWLDHNNQYPWANSAAPGNKTIGGVNYNKYTNTGVGSGWTVLTYINTGSGVLNSSNFNIRAVIDDAVSSFGIPSSYYVSAIEFGNEVVNGGGITEISNWSVNVGAAAGGSSGGSGIVSGKTYEISSQLSGLALNVAGASTTNGANVQQWPYAGTGHNDQWVVTSVGGGYYKIINVKSGKGLDVAGATNGANVQQWSYGGGNNQQFQIVSVGGGQYKVIDRNSGKGLNVANASKSKGANIIIWPYGSGDQNSQWTFKQLN